MICERHLGIVRMKLDSTDLSKETNAAIGVSIQHVSKAFGAVTALSEINLEVAGHSLVVLLGPSGCGKTTLLRILCGLDTATSGTVRIGSAIPDMMRRQGRIGIAFQEPALFPWLSVLENIALPLRIQGRNDSGLVHRLIGLVRLAGAEQQLPGELSGGMAQRVAVARALVGRPDLLLLDEPFGALDWFLRRHIIEEFEELWLRERPTTIMVTHDTREAVFLADRIAILSDRPGKIAWSLDIELPRPRPRDIFAQTEFHSICDLIDKRNESVYG